MQNSNFMVLYSWQIERGVYMKKMFLRFGQCFAALAFVFATVTANSSCMIIAHQPEEPALRKNLCKFNNSDKKRYCERLEKQPLNFFTVYNTYRNLSSFFNSQSAGMERSGMEAD